MIFHIYAHVILVSTFSTPLNKVPLGLNPKLVNQIGGLLKAASYVTPFSFSLPSSPSSSPSSSIPHIVLKDLRPNSFFHVFLSKPYRRRRRRHHRGRKSGFEKRTWICPGSYQLMRRKKENGELGIPTYPLENYCLILRHTEVRWIIIGSWKN